MLCELYLSKLVMRKKHQGNKNLLVNPVVTFQSSAYLNSPHDTSNLGHSSKDLGYGPVL